MDEKNLDLTDETPVERPVASSLGFQIRPFNLEERREGTRGDLARAGWRARY
jgi:hypothetical protein